MSVLRPVTFRTRVINLLLALSAPTARVLRVIAPIVHPPFMKMFLVTRYDDVREVFLNDRVYGVLYKSNLDVILDRQPFILGIDDTPEYRAQIAALRAVVEASDPAALAAKSTVVAERLLRAANGRLEFVNFVRQITFEVLCPYFGITRVAQDVLEEWATRLFEYQFTYTGKNIPLLHDTALQAEGREMAESLRQHVDRDIAARGGIGTPNDLMGRCLLRQASGASGYRDDQIRTGLIGLLLAIPQLPTVLPRVLEQLLRRPRQLACAQQAAREGDTATVARYLFEAMRFDPLAPAVQRRSSRDAVLAAGTSCETRIPASSIVLPSFASAMRDPRRVANPERFDPDRPASDYIHFGYGMHHCFGEATSRAMLPAMLQAILTRPIQRAPGADGHLRRRGFFSDALWVTWQPRP